MSDDYFTGLIKAKCLPHWPGLIRAEATRWGMKDSELIRSLIAEGLERRGNNVAAPPASRTAGDLYDVVGGQRRFALIEGDTIATMSYHAERPSNGDWRPVHHQDSEAFDIATKLRMKPNARIEADRVLVVYPVVDRAMELA